MGFKHSFAVLSVFAVAVIASPHAGHCPSDHFYYQPKNACLPNGGPKSHVPHPPAGKSCPPSSHYWSKDFSCCVPNHPPPPHAPPPQCSHGHEWNKATQCCEPHGPPSHTHHTHKPSQTPTYPGHGDGHGDHDHDHDHDHDGDHDDHSGDKGHGNPPKKPKGNYKKRSAAPLCPTSLEACPISGLTVLTGAEYECLDTMAELKSCGGCASTGKGHDCTAIKGAWNVGCEQGSCAVYTCALGFRVSKDGKSCERN